MVARSDARTSRCDSRCCPAIATRVLATVGHMAELVSALEDYLDDPLPNAKLDLVDVPHLFGAMEHPGLITFERTILASNGSPEDIDEFDRTVGHELAHQWFGNSVTPAWWDDLWLAEAFASFLGDRVAATYGTDRPFQRAQLREHALAVDSGPDARPLRRGVTDDPEGAFDAISYDKGEIVLATFEHWLGADRFRSALRSYVRAHREGTATVDDVVAAVTAVSSPALGAALKFYVEHVGPPVVALTLRCDTTPPVIEAEAASGGAIPLCVRTPAGRVMRARRQAHRDSARHVPGVGRRRRRRWVLPRRLARRRSRDTTARATRARRARRVRR